MELNLLPFIIEALGNNKKIYKDIDKVYQANKYEFYKAAKEHELYNHQMVTEGSLLQEEYCKKILGIIAAAGKNEEINDKLYDLIFKAYRWTYLYVENHQVIKFQDYHKAFAKKFKNNMDSNDNPIDYNFNILLILSLNNGNEIIRDEKYNEILMMMHDRLGHYKDALNTRISLNKVNDTGKYNIKKLKNDIYKKYGIIKNYDDIVRNVLEEKKMEQCTFLFDYERLSSDSIFQDIKFTDGDIDFILYLYILENENLENIQDATKFLISYMYILYLIKAYKQVKQMYFENNKETMYVELDGLEKLLNANEEQLFTARQGLSELQKTHGLLEKENIRLKAELEDEKRNRQELNGLREFIFDLDKQIECKDIEINLDGLKSFKAVLIGGHEKWQQKMKENLPSFIFVHPDNMNFDARIVDNINVVFIYPNYLNHSIYYKIMSAIEGKNIKVVYLNQQNEEKVLRSIYKNIIN